MTPLQPSSPSEAHPARSWTKAGRIAADLPLVATALRTPGRIAMLDPAGWDLLVRQARRVNLLGRLHAAIVRAGLIDAVPASPKRHLQSAAALAAKHARDVRWEVLCIDQALAGLETPVVLLKGAAYIMAGLPAAEGRLFSDVDIMVPLDALDAVEARLRALGWYQGKADAYDDAYYRRWMHQIPPLVHRHRRTVLDVHHAIMPRTARIRPDSDLLFGSTVPIGAGTALRRLGDADLVLHSATHLFNEGDFDNGLRDLSDMDLLLRHFGRRDGFWQDLVRRAAALGLETTVGHAVRHCRRVFGTPVPEDAVAAVSAARSPGLRAQVMDFALAKALVPDHPSCSGMTSAAARSLLYVRGHYLRMPLSLLVPHLARKAMVRRSEGDR